MLRSGWVDCTDCASHDNSAYTEKEYYIVGISIIYGIYVQYSSQNASSAICTDLI